MNTENLIPLNQRTKEEQREIAKIGGVCSGKSRKRKAELRKIVQNLLDGDYTMTDENGEVMELTGAEAIAYRLFATAMDEKNKNCLAAIKLIIDIVGQSGNQLDEKKKKTEIKYLEARTKLLSGSDEEDGKFTELLKAIGSIDSVIE